MAITLTVLTIDGVADPHGLSATFDALGGTIGRAADNQLVLPDPGRGVSRLHAQLVCRAGDFAVIDRGSQPVLLNGQALGRDREAALRPGDRLRIGAYLLMASAAPPAVSSHALPDAADAAAAGGIPHDWDPFADAPALPRVAPFSAADTVGAAADEMSLDALFGLGAGGAVENPASRPSPLAATLFRPDAPDERDLLRSLDRISTATADTVRDDLPDLQRPFIRPRPPEAQPPAAPAPAPAPDSEAGSGALLAALRDGLDCPGLVLDTLDPALMRLIGQLLRGSMQGALDLLRTRQGFKREVHAELTVIGLRDNNTLKFSPDVEAALQQLLLPTPRGFMGPAASVQQAFAELDTHQQAMAAGIRATVAGLLDRLDPAVIAAHRGPVSAWRRLRPGGDAAGLWDTFVAQHGALLRQAAADPRTLFDDAFREAYGAQPAPSAPPRLRHRPDPGPDH